MEHEVTSKVKKDMCGRRKGEDEGDMCGHLLGQAQAHQTPLTTTCENLPRRVLVFYA